jgi:hypothetical protein
LVIFRRGKWKEGDESAPDMHLAVYFGNIEVVESLLGFENIKFVKNARGMSPSFLGVVQKFAFHYQKLQICRDGRGVYTHWPSAAD